jgi:hypothetical protein
MKRTDAFGLDSLFTLWAHSESCNLWLANSALFSITLSHEMGTYIDPVATYLHFNQCRRRGQLGERSFLQFFADNQPVSRFDSSHRTPGKDPKQKHGCPVLGPFERRCPNCLRRLACVDLTPAVTWRDPVHIGSLLPRTDASSRAARGANPGVGPFQCNCSTESNRGMSVRRVANSRNKKARSRS